MMPVPSVTRVAEAGCIWPVCGDLSDKACHPAAMMQTCRDQVAEITARAEQAEKAQTALSAIFKISEGKARLHTPTSSFGLLT